MPCPVCGEICQCSSTPASDGAQSTGWCDAASGSSDIKVDSSVNPEEWRTEVAARLNRYQARRKPRPPRYPSLRLRFEGAEVITPNPNPTATERGAITSSTNNALALQRFADGPELFASRQEAPREVIVNEEEIPAVPRSAAVSPAKIIEFPRPWTPPPRPADELAEPVITAPRILDVPEFSPPAPALGGITIEPARRVEIERRPGIDFPLQSASLGRRMAAAAADATIVLIACAIFGYIFWRITAIRPARLQILEIAAGMGSLLWATYQYLLNVYSASTPGLRLCGLRLCRFDGSGTKRRLRRWRVIASFLSAVSLGMGYAWIFLDEDALCWHDRITHTYLAPRHTDADLSNAGG